MSYPDKEKRVDNQSGKVENRPTEPSRKKPNPPLKELSKEQESRLPVGKLKWSKEEEEVQDTQLNLGNNKQQPNSPAPKMDEDHIEKASTKEVHDQIAASQSSENLSEPYQSSPEGNDNSKQRSLSLEDTLTPIDFKEYPIEPDPKEETSSAKNRSTRSKGNSNMSTLDLGEDDGDHTDEGESSQGKVIAKKALKILWLPLLLIIVLIVGLMFGHSFGGESATGVFDLSMWEHIYDLIYSE
ncbi:DNA-directed RNA polymerase subunit beta [Hazenella coriacea]|uniref:DNA-directed RNA polymerase subunit beta n=1 Tax=Hazenella coriacea TaxID=1179467 RepID=A0A4R3L8T8_9BACL|nr:DNA-directed RNA polymerase subunit beta [Hazenella coriacea]TCS95618.1 DNA-directed RNA polymerase subunit beta [Hazenella coriacea]